MSVMLLSVPDAGIAVQYQDHSPVPAKGISRLFVA